jgi:biopolymer transport protein ExbD
MKFRKKHKGEASEVFTDSLNDILFILLMFFLIVATLANPNVVNVNNPKGTKDTKAKQDITISIDKDQQFFLGTTRYAVTEIDSALAQEIRRFQSMGKDTPTVIINADSASFYGEVFRILRVSKTIGAKVAATVKD